ncbi:uncharacterized protein TRIREDRAFT_109967 [Trichoderma reesei QM6a]|jgi:hypothetical protein|uniref:Predicted protein n=2 Tax=Hypocrea jecorina TaxID=51453 RepID=G0RQV8_HYPJQ|nr:uncharacterized protein TRIREDRAFT_109967 [Trichoderma reesei QM6a]EGR46330.1 predicted protein [Trichoderma reesei QM6a]ETR99564.1 hypothetical protein M419DRAFT_10896 [Trichoderma reesei RUT C-30]
MATTPLARQKTLGYSLLLFSWLWHALFAAYFVVFSVWSLRGAFRTFDDQFRALLNTKTQAVVMSIFFLAYTLFHIAAVFPNFSWVTSREVDVEQASQAQGKARVYGVAKKAEHLCRAARYLIVLRVVLALVNGVLLAVVWRWMDKFRANGDDENVLYCIAIIVVLAIETVESFLSAAVFWLPKILQTA